MTRFFQNGLAAAFAILLCAASFGIITTVPAEPAFAAGHVPTLA